MGSNRWTEDEEDLILEAWPELAVVPNRNPDSVWQHAKQMMGLKRDERLFSTEGEGRTRNRGKLSTKQADKFTDYINKYYN